MVLRVPHISYGAGHLGVASSYSILGYGDVVLPGLLCVYLRLVSHLGALTYPKW